MSLSHKERPIIFQTTMIRAYMEGRKNQTRRTRGLEKINQEPDAYTFACRLKDGTYMFDYKKGIDVIQLKCPYGETGDYLWFKETRVIKTNTTTPEIECGHFTYKADDTENLWRKELGYKQLSAMFMPRWAARFTRIPIISIKAERLQNIPFEDLLGEGIPGNFLSYEGAPKKAMRESAYSQYLIQYEKLWDSINFKKYPWSLNPWIWAIKFPYYKE